MSLGTEGVTDEHGPGLIVAVGRDRAIGRGGGLPWHAPEDLAHFKRITMGHHVVIGSRTWESIGRPLPGRTLVVVSRRALDLPDGAVLAPDPDAGLDLALVADPSPLVGGGTSVYEALLPRVVRIHRTDVAVVVEGADATFPATDPSEWEERSVRAGTDPRLTFCVLDRVPAARGL